MLFEVQVNELFAVGLSYPEGHLAELDQSLGGQVDQGGTHVAADQSVRLVQLVLADLLAHFVLFPLQEVAQTLFQKIVDLQFLA